MLEVENQLFLDESCDLSPVVSMTVTHCEQVAVSEVKHVCLYQVHVLVSFAAEMA